MSTTDVQLQPPLSPDHDIISEPIDRSKRPHDDHEANGRDQTDLASEAPNPSGEPVYLSSGTLLSPGPDALPEDTTNATVNIPLSEGPGDALAATKATVVKSPVKKTLSVSTSATTKAKEGLASAVATKTGGTSPGKKSATAVSRSISGPGGTTPTSPLKRSTTVSTMSKPAPSITRPSVTSATTPSRRISLATAGTKSMPSTTSRTSLASSMTSKATAAEPGIAHNRASVISPSGSVSSLKSTGTSGIKPRASISEAATKKPASIARSVATTKSTTSLASTAPRTSTRTLSGTAPKSSLARPGSISSIKEDGNTKALEDLRNRLNATSDELKSKIETVAELEGQIENLKLSLETLQTEMETKNLQANEIESSRAALEMTFQKSKDELAGLQIKYEESQSALNSLKEELVAARTAATSSSELNTKFNEQISTLESELSSAKDNLVTLQTSYDATALEAATTAAADKEALLKAHSDLGAIVAETEQLKQVQVSTLDEAQKKIEMLEKRVQEAGSLQFQLNALNVEKEETATKVSELEIEILELKEAQEVLEDECDKSRNTIKTLQDNFDQSKLDVLKAAEDLRTTEARHAAAIGDLQLKHAGELMEAAKEHTQVSQTLQTTRGDLEATNLELEKAKKAAVDIEENHKLKTLEIEQAYVTVQKELTEKLASISAELESQETQYNVKIQGVKDEYDQLLQQAFERAKHEAGEDHAKELQALRAQSKAAIEEIQAANSNTLRELKAEHASILESEIQGLNKRLSNSKLELKATQDDLAKAKSALEVSRSEAQSLKEQLEEVKAATEAELRLAPERVAENERLKRALSDAEADLVVTTEILNLTKSSMTEMSDHHARDLEEAAKARADEMSKLRATHEEEVVLLTQEKDDLSVKLSDTEGELATVRAELGSLKAAPKANSSDVVTSHDAMSPSGSVVTDEMLSQVHEAHNLKLGDLMVVHDKAMNVLQQKLDDAQKKIRDLGEEVSRKTMEIQFMESENDEQSEAMTRLKDDTRILRDQLVKAGMEPQVSGDANEE